MSSQDFNFNVHNYNKVRDFLRYIFIYGCYSREDFPQMSKRKYDDELRRVREIIEKEYLEENIRTKRKYVSITYDYYKNIENYLVSSYQVKSFTKNQIFLFFLIQQILAEAQKALELNEILVKIEDLSTEKKEDREIKNTLLRQLNKMVEWGLLEKFFVRKNCFFSLTADFFTQFSEEELLQIKDCVDFFSHITYPCTPGYYLKRTLQKYLISQSLVEKESIFLYQYTYFQSILDEEVIWQLLQALDTGKKIELTYQLRNGKKIITFKLVPLKVILDLQYGRWFLVALDKEEEKVFPVQRIRKVELLAEEFSQEKRLTYWQNRHQKSWLAAGTADKLQLVQVKFHLEKKKPNNYLLERVKREGRGGKIILLDEYTFLFSVELADLSEIRPWLRSFGHRAEILKPTELRAQFQSDWEEMAKNYGII